MVADVRINVRTPRSAPLPRRSFLGAVAVAALAGASLISPSLAGASAPPVLTSVGLDAQNHLTATWTKPATSLVDSEQICWANSSSVQTGDYVGSRLITLPPVEWGCEHLQDEATSYVTTSTFGGTSGVFGSWFGAGTWYVQVRTSGFNSGPDYDETAAHGDASMTSSAITTPTS